MNNRLQDPVARLPALFVSHGGSWLTMRESDPANRWMRAAGEQLRQLNPAAIVMLSAHYEAASVRVLSHPHPRTLHDHPARDLYRLNYGARGEPALARRIVEMLQAEDIAATEDLTHGFDHGAWIPLTLMFPAADVPVVMVSLHRDLDPATHFAIGKAIAGLRNEGTLIIGSGSITHNLRDFFDRYSHSPDADFVPRFSHEFDHRVRATLASSTGADAAHQLAQLLTQPVGRQAHPRTEHFLPLFGILGSSGDTAAKQVHSGFQYGLSMAAYQFDSKPSKGDATP